MPVSEVTSDYSGSLTPTTSAEESEEEEEEIVRSRRVSESSSLLWSGTGAKRSPLIIFRSESLVSKEKKTKAIGEKYHLAYKMVKTESKLVRSILTTYGFHEVHPNSADFNLMWTGAHLKPFSLRSLQDYQKVNHFPRSYEITRKDRLYKNVDRMAHTKGAKHFDFMPRSYLMPSEYQEFSAAYVKDKGPWIVKPIASSRGRGIYLINNPNQVPLEDNIMVCKYIGNPLLIDGFKFDIRVYIAVTSYDPLLIYLFEEGLTRFATVKYEKTNKQLKNQMMHLTNYSINKKSHDYVRCEDPEVEDYGNKWSMSAMLRYLKQEGVDTNALMMRIEAVIIKSIISAELPIATACRMFVPHRENCIELYGFDILVDENLKPWLLEGNLSPSLACDAPLDFKIKSSMVSDFFSLAGFQCVDPMTRKQKKDPLRPQNKRPVSASGSKDSTLSSNSGMSGEEVKALRIAKEQYQRRGGFIRIFPTAETWELYGSFLEYKSSLNLMLAQKLFPDRVKSRGTAGAYSSALARMRHIAAGQTMEGRNKAISGRFMQYERKLLSVESRKKRTAKETKKRKKTPIGIDNQSSISQGQLRKVNQVTMESDVSDAEEASDVSLTNNETEKRPTSRSSNRPVSRPSGDTKRGTSSQASITNGVKKSKEVRSKSKTDISKSSKDELTGLKKVTQKIYSYKPPPKSTYSSNIVTGSKKQTQSNAPKQTRQQNNDSSTDDYSSSEDEDEKPVSTGSNKFPPKPKQKEPFNVLQVLKAGGNLGKVQARLAFSAYLSRVQNRLMTESEIHVQEVAENAGKQEEQMDLVLRFLKRAAGNLRQAFSVVVPSRRLTLPDRKRILAKQLGDFVHIYNKETDAMEQKSALGLEKDSSLLNSYRLPGSGSISMAASANSSVIKDSDFRGFVTNATETELEEVLTTYTHKNKSASVFLGASKPRPAKDKISASRDAVNRIHSRQPVLMQPSSIMYQAEEHREGSFDIPPATRRMPQQMLRVRSSSPSASIASRNGSMVSSAMSSIQQASYIYSTKLTPPTAVVTAKEQQRRPASARAVNYSSTTNVTSSSSQHLLGRPVSAAGATGSLHYQTGTNAANEEAISEALQRLAERQAARQYSATSQLHALTQHLSNLNLANMNSTRQQLNSGAGVQLISQRTSSLTDLANLDSAGDYLKNDGKGMSSNQYNNKQLLAKQSKELLQESKAKHQAMVAQAHTMVTSQLNKNTKDTRPLSAAASMQCPSLRPSPNNNIHKGPSLSPPSSVAAKKIPASDLRPPQVPHPPDAPKPPPVIRKPLGTTKVNRSGSHPQLNGLSPKPSKTTTDEKNFYNSLKYDTSTCATRINESSNKDAVQGNQTRIIIPRPSSAKLQPSWKP